MDGPRGIVVCFSVDHERPDSYMVKVAKELKKKAYHGEVLLDLLATNGDNSRRFVSLHFDGNTLHWLQAKLVKVADIDRETYQFCQLFYAKNPAVLSNSVLSMASQERIKKDWPVLS